MVPSDVVGDEPEDGGERLGVAADVGSAQLQDRLDVVAVEVERGRLGRIRLRRLLHEAVRYMLGLLGDTVVIAAWRLDAAV